MMSQCLLSPSVFSPCWAPAAPSWAWTQWGRGPRWTAQLARGWTALCRCWDESVSAAGCPHRSWTHIPHSYNEPATWNENFMEWTTFTLFNICATMHHVCLKPYFLCLHPTMIYHWLCFGQFIGWNNERNKSATTSCGCGIDTPFCTSSLIIS